MCIRPADGPAGLRVHRVAAVLAAAALATMFLDTVARAQGYPARFELGTPAAGQDIAPIDIAVPADGKGLPPGSGDYAKGKAVYETACAACHGADLMGVAGLPNMPNGAQLRLIGGRGTLASENPVLTVESYWPYATTLFDYVRRAMPFTAPGSLRADEVYAVCAYILAEGKVIEKSTILDAKTLPRVAMPNRDGFIPDPRPEMFR
jgi:S-disulfanyl-L-cysteine oxidoreductase SoxD